MRIYNQVQGPLRHTNTFAKQGDGRTDEDGNGQVLKRKTGTIIERRTKSRGPRGIQPKNTQHAGAREGKGAKGREGGDTTKFNRDQVQSASIRESKPPVGPAYRSTANRDSGLPIGTAQGVSNRDTEPPVGTAMPTPGI